MMFLYHFLVGVFAVVLIIIGAITAVMPIPFGIIFMIIGFILLGVVAPPVRPALRNARRRWGWLDDRLDEAQEKLPESIASPLRESDPCDVNPDR